MFTWVAELAFGESQSFLLVGKAAYMDSDDHTAPRIPDTLVFFTMLYKTIVLFNRMPRSTRAASILQVLLRDGEPSRLCPNSWADNNTGVVYFAVIFVSNLVTLLIYVVCISAFTICTQLRTNYIICSSLPQSVQKSSDFREYRTDLYSPPPLQPDLKVINASFSTL